MQLVVRIEFTDGCSAPSGERTKEIGYFGFHSRRVVEAQQPELLCLNHQILWLVRKTKADRFIGIDDPLNDLAEKALAGLLLSLH